MRTVCNVYTDRGYGCIRQMRSYVEEEAALLERAEVRGPMGSLFQHQKEVRGGGRKAKEEVVRIGGSRAVTAAVGQGVLSRKFGLGWRKSPSTQTRIVQNKVAVA